MFHAYERHAEKWPNTKADRYAAQYPMLHAVDNLFMWAQHHKLTVSLDYYASLSCDEEKRRANAGHPPASLASSDPTSAKQAPGHPSDLPTSKLPSSSRPLWTPLYGLSPVLGQSTAPPLFPMLGDTPPVVTDYRRVPPPSYQLPDSLPLIDP